MNKTNKIMMGSILQSIINTPENKKRHEQLQKETEKNYQDFKRNNLEKEYRLATLESYRVEQEIESFN